jgi:hypothetical protein
MPFKKRIRQVIKLPVARQAFLALPMCLLVVKAPLLDLA